MKDPEIDPLGKGRFALDLPNFYGLGSTRVVVSRRVLAELVRVATDVLAAHPEQPEQAGDD